jgi:hypothetical protein
MFATLSRLTRTKTELWQLLLTQQQAAKGLFSIARFDGRMAGLGIDYVKTPTAN